MIGRQIARLLGMATLGLASLGASAQATKVNVGYVPAGDWVPALVAKDKGIFDKHGLDVTLTKVAIISNIPAALMSGSLQIGVSTPTVLIDTADSGLDMAAIAGGTRFVKDPAIFSVVVRNGLTVKSAKDLEGKRVGVPGMRSIADVLLRKWLLDQGVQPSKVNLVEASFPQMKDLLKGGTVDAVAVLEPFRSRIVSDQTGYRLADYVAEVNPDLLGGIWVARQQWLNANPKAAQAFRASLTEAIEFMRKNPDEAKAIEAKHLGFTTPVALPYSVSLNPADFEVYGRIGREVGYLQKPVDGSRLMAK
ncbi:ABC transporter substrate-binding protein [Ramlibacter sp. AW1]|uniref:ABC transporter substrate-binding protein n=1 Tax=Ramlibacter aurantiacus TaxID=2801330 RepID=A0A937D639_9BURK|nr:ABC transporter substrate-binding protein [Ramlibacter aurantiacus]MBL0423350.1 ABC transporter substrate-binding protein [Ramlibacter aurantiacus]